MGFQGRDLVVIMRMQALLRESFFFSPPSPILETYSPETPPYDSYKPYETSAETYAAESYEVSSTTTSYGPPATGVSSYAGTFEETNADESHFEFQWEQIKQPICSKLTSHTKFSICRL